MSRRIVLWIAFAIVHLVVGTLGFSEPNLPLGDVPLVYLPWSSSAIAGDAVVGITETWVYPSLALLPMVLAHGFAWINGYTVGWAILATACNALVFWMLIGRGRSMSRTIAAWFWLGFILLLGPVGIYRIDAITVPIAIAGCLWLFARPRVAAVLFTVGAWVKVWPAALFVTALVVARRRLELLAAGALVSAAVVAVAAAAGGIGHVFGFVTEQTGRGLQIEAPVSTWWLWQAVIDPERASLYYDTDILTFQLQGPGVATVSALMTPLLALVAGGIVAIGAYKVLRGARFGRLMPPLALALVLAFIVCNKVGSPQFQTWLIAPLVLAVVLNRHRAWPTVVLGLLSAGLTHLVYPIMYGEVLSVDPLGIAVLSARNLVLVILLVVAVTQLSRVPGRDEEREMPAAAAVPGARRAAPVPPVPPAPPGPATSGGGAAAAPEPTPPEPTSPPTPEPTPEPQP